MILKASQRGGGQGLAVHLMRTDENEHVEVHELRGFASDDLSEAFKEAEAVSRATKCRQYLFSLSLNPPQQADVPIAAFEDAIERIERKLGLQGQPRAIVFHEKEGRRHAHCVWSRIDSETLRAKQMSFFKTKLQAVSRELYLDHDWEMPRGLMDHALRDPRNFNLAEWQQAKRSGVDPRLFKAAVQDCWHRSDSPRAFVSALEERGLFLAKGDRRGHVIVDSKGEVYALARTLSMKVKEVRQRLGRAHALPSVTETRQRVSQTMTPVLTRHVQDARKRFQTRSATLAHKTMMMRDRHRIERSDLKEKQAERAKTEAKERTAKLPRGLSGLWSRITGQYQKIRRENEAAAELAHRRDVKEREHLVFSQLKERRRLQSVIRAERSLQATLLWDLRDDRREFARLAQRQDRTRQRSPR